MSLQGSENAAEREPRAARRSAPVRGGPGATRVSLSAALPSCEFYPIAVDPDRGLMAFSRTRREIYRSAAFMTAQSAAKGRRSHVFNLDDLLIRGVPKPGVAELAPASAGPTHGAPPSLALATEAVPSVAKARPPAVGATTPPPSADHFFRGAASLFAQLAWRLALAGARGETLWSTLGGNDGASGFPASKSREVLAAAADQCFGAETLTQFLIALRAWARRALAAEHASSPIVLAANPAARRALAAESAPATWRYFYGLTPTCSPSRVTLRHAALSPRRGWLPFAFSRVVANELDFNQLRVVAVTAPWGLESSRSGDAAPSAVQAGGAMPGGLVLTGWLW